jgi:hypothetical protein
MQNGNNSEVRDALLLAAGLSMVVLGTGIILSNPRVRQAVVATLTPLLPELKGPLSQGIAGIMPDFERYIKMKGM